MASMVIILSLRSYVFNTMGILVISFDLSGVTALPNVADNLGLYALYRCLKLPVTEGDWKRWEH